MDKESPEERLAKVPIKPVERESLERVFEHLSIIRYHINVSKGHVQLISHLSTEIKLVPMTLSRLCRR